MPTPFRIMTADGTGDDTRLHAVLTRDRSADGRFVYGVTTTGIYCRPSCPSRKPKAENIVFLPRRRMRNWRVIARASAATRATPARRRRTRPWWPKPAE